VTVLVAGGTHAPASPDDVRRKVGPVVAAAVRVVPHDCRRDVVSIGRSQRGTPLSVNRLLVECDLKIGVGCVHPHPAAGFSGGSKIVMPAACGFETARAMHDYVKGAGRRGGSLDTALRREIEEVAARVGLDFIVNAVLTADRRVEAVFAGDRVLAHRAAVRCFERLGRVQPVPDADVVVADMYPFDCNLQFAYDRGLWPVLAAGTGVSKVVVAACPLGTGSHDLYPVARMWRARLRRRLRRLRPRDLADPLEKLRVLLRMIAGGRQELSFLAPGLSATDLRTVFPRGRRYDQWPGLLADLTARRRREPVRVAVYRCAPLLLPELEPRGGA
jgi:nickel-dependent lactate racemase